MVPAVAYAIDSLYHPIKDVASASLGMALGTSRAASEFLVPLALDYSIDRAVHNPGMWLLGKATNIGADIIMSEKLW